MLLREKCVPILGIALVVFLQNVDSTNSSEHETRAPKPTSIAEEFDYEYETTEKPRDITTKEFRLPLCALPKKGPLICYAICVFLLNDRGSCKPHNICSCTVNQTLSPGMLFGLFG